MNVEDIASQLNIEEKEAKEIVEEYVEHLKNEEKFVTPTYLREELSQAHHSNKMIVTYLLQNEENVVKIPATTRGKLLAHTENIDNIVDTALDGKK